MVARDLPRHRGLFPAHLMARRALLYDPCRVGDLRLFGGSPMEIERYDKGLKAIDEKGIVTFERGAKVA